MSLRLIIEDDEGTTTVVPLGAEAITIGRQQGNTIQLTEKNVSRRHARLFPEPDHDTWFIEDLGSYNGVKVNGSAVEGRLELSEGDVVQIGDYNLALTDNVDKSTQNYGGAVGAANDNGAATDEPALVSSSTDLPRLSSDDVAALNSGASPAVAPVASISGSGSGVIDSGASPAISTSSGGFEEDRKSSKGMLIGFGAVVVIALIVGVGWMASSGGGESTAGSEVAASAGEKPKPKPRLSLDDGDPALDPKAMAGVADSAASPDPIDPVVDPDAEPDSGQDAVEVEPDDSAGAVDPPEPEPKRNPKRPRNTKKKPRPPKTPPPAAPEPEVDAKALLSEARKASLTQHGKCYDLAQQAYKANRSTAASELMAKCACNMGDAGKAKRAAARLSGTKLDKVTKLCGLKGITL